jgi:Cu/Ag efflux pump CusA
VLAGVIRWSLDRPWLILSACLAVLIAAVIYVSDMPVALLPDLAPAEAEVQTEAPGLTAEQVEQLVTRPLESALAGTLGVAHVRSQSAQGLSLVTLTLAADADPLRTREAMLERLTAAEAALPSGVQPPQLWPMRSARTPALQIAVVGAKLDPMALRDAVEWTLRPRLLAAPGVAEVTVLGGRVRRIEVRARPADLSDSDLGFLDILRATRRATGVAGAGFIDTPNQRVLIAAHGQALTPEAVGAGQIQTPGAAPVRIADVADVVEAPAPGFGDALVDGRPAVLVSVYGQRGANLLQVTHGAERALAALKPALAAQGLTVRDDLDRPASFVVRTLRGLGVDLLIGAALAAIALLLALRDGRPVLASLAVLPLAMAIALAAMKALGWSLNLMTLGGLAVALGVVMDDAIIDMENIAAHLRDAERRRASTADAVLAAALEVRGPVIYATVGMIAAVAPLLALTGVQGTLLRPFAGAVVAASLASLAVAVLVIPPLALLALRRLRAEPASRTGRLRGAVAAGLRAVDAAPRFVLAAALAACGLLVASLLLVRAELLPPVHADRVSLATEGPPAISLEAMDGYGARLSRALAALPDVRAVSAQIGRDPTGRGAAGLGSTAFDLALTPGLSDAAQERVRRRAAATLALYPGFQAAQGAPPGEDQASAPPFTATIFGRDLDTLDRSAAAVAGALRGLPGGRSAHAATSAKAPVVQVDVNFERLAIYGLSVGDVLDTVQAAFAGERVAQIYEGDRAVDLAITAQTSLRRDPEAVGALLLRSSSGVSVPLGSVANVYLADGRALIEHDDGLRRQVVIADPPREDAARFAQEAPKAIARQVRLAPGEFIDYAGAGREAAASRANLALGYGLALLAILGVLTLGFDGRSAAVIVVSTLFSLAGGALAVFALGGGVSAGPIAGLLSLFGVAIRNGVLLISRLEELIVERRRAWSFETVAQAVQDRLVPLLLSATTVTLALAPIALQAGRGGFEVLGPMAIVVISGLATGALASLFLIPVLVQAFWRPAYARLARRRRTHAPGED